MANLTFNPFDQDFEQLQPADLSKLREVAEGWYVEYKQEVVSTKNIAKSLAAFANHYGGWIFYGVLGAKDGSNVAIEFPGINEQEVAILIERIRNAAKDVVNPSPYYEYNVLKGPSPEIGLSDNKSIVVVIVPIGADTPYIHSDGRIYRRVADASDPKPETDRFTLDYLWQRRVKAHEKLAIFLEQEPTLSKAEENQSFIDLFLLTDPLQISGKQFNLNFEKFVEIMSDAHAPGMSIIYDNFYTMAQGMIARHINFGDPYNLVATWRFYRNGSSQVSIPISSMPISVIESGGWLHKYKYEKEFLDYAKQNGYTANYVMDINQMIFAVVATIAQHKRLLSELGDAGPIYAKAVIHNIWRKTPFLDTENYISFINKHGLPVLQFEKEFAPPDNTFESLIRIKEAPSIDEPHQVIIAQTVEATPLVSFVANALGLSQRVAFGEEDGDEWWGSAAMRAPEANKWRQEKFRHTNVNR